MSRHRFAVVRDEQPAIVRRNLQYQFIRQAEVYSCIRSSPEINFWREPENGANYSTIKVIISLKPYLHDQWKSDVEIVHQFGERLQDKLPGCVHE